MERPGEPILSFDECIEGYGLHVCAVGSEIGELGQSSLAIGLTARKPPMAKAHSYPSGEYKDEGAECKQALQEDDSGY